MVTGSEDGEILLNKIVAAVFFNNKEHFISKIYITNHRLIIKNIRNQVIKISYSDIYEISVENQNEICIRCYYPMRFFDEKEKNVNLFFYGLKRKDGGGLIKLSDPKWTIYWKDFIENRVNVYNKNIADKKKVMQLSDKELNFIDGVKRVTLGLGKFECVKTREILNIWIDGFIFPSCKIYTTLKQIVMKLDKEDFIIIPYSVVYKYYKETTDKICIIFSFPQNIRGFENMVSRICIESNQIPVDKYYEKRSWKWTDEWIELLKQVTLQFRENKSVISTSEILEMIIEMKHSPTRNTLSILAQQGWDKACALAIERMRINEDDFFLYLDYLLSKYEEMKIRLITEPDPAMKEVLLGSEMAYSDLLISINRFH
jgi:hypothetical protein